MTQAQPNHQVLESQASLPTLLVVDEHRVTADIERNHYLGAGFAVHVAATLEEARQLAAENHIDLIMIDVGFHQGLGLDVMKMIKKSSRNPHVKCLATSILCSPEIRKQAELAGADSFMIRPAPQPKLLKEIKNLTRQQSRDAERVHQCLSVRIYTDGHHAAASSLDVSADGIHLHCSNQMRPAIHSKIEMEIQIEGEAVPVKISGLVVRHTSEGFGVSFKEMSKMARRILDKFMLKNSMEGRTATYYL